jgi:putative heme-binding domain-containing protein
VLGDLARLLRNSPFPDVKKKAEALLPPPPKLDPNKLPSIPALLTRKGNLNRGKAILDATLKNDAACLKCHTVNGVGDAIGPDLSAIGSKVSRENLLESILYPSKAISDQFQTWVVETKNGQVFTGVITGEAGNFLMLRDAAYKEHKISKADVESRTKSEKSLMPDDLIRHLPENDLIDLVEYLYTLKGTTIGSR